MAIDWAGWSETGEGAAGDPVEVTRPGEAGRYHFVSSVAFSYDKEDARGLAEIVVDGTVRWRQYFTGSLTVNFRPVLRCCNNGSGGVDVAARITGKAGAVGLITLVGQTLRNDVVRAWER